MKTTSTLVSSLVLILSLVACGGSESKDDGPHHYDDSIQSSCTAIQLSAWGSCQSNGTRTRTVLAGDCTITQPLVESCAFCQSIGRLSCVPPSGQSVCCPQGAPFYCPSLTLCYTNATDAVNACWDPVICTG
jgi:hypothetical protein